MNVDKGLLQPSWIMHDQYDQVFIRNVGNRKVLEGKTSLEWYLAVCCIIILYRWLMPEFNIISEWFSWGSFVYAFSAHTRLMYGKYSQMRENWDKGKRIHPE